MFQVLPQDLALYKGGNELLTCVDDMTAKVNLFRAEQKAQQLNIGDTLPRNDETLLVPPPAPSEIKGLLSSPVKEMSNGKTCNGDIDNGGIKVNIENGILSLHDSQFDERDKTVNADLA